MLDRLERLEAEMREVRRRLDVVAPVVAPVPIDPMSLEPIPKPEVESNDDEANRRRR